MDGTHASAERDARWRENRRADARRRTMDGRGEGHAETQQPDNIRPSVCVRRSESGRDGSGIRDQEQVTVTSIIFHSACARCKKYTALTT